MRRSFLRCWDGTAFLFRPLSHRPDESAASYSLASCTPALLASASPADFILNSGPEFNQPPPSGGWGIFDRLYGDFSSGLDTVSPLTLSLYAEMGSYFLKSDLDLPTP
jgi:hypothetical protein